MRKKRAQTLILFTLSIILFSIIPVLAFIRGDANQDNRVDISDSIFIYNYLYQGGDPLECEDAADINDDGRVDISDPVYLNNYLYQGGPEPPSPFQQDHLDPTPDVLTCGPEGHGAIEGDCKDDSRETNEGPGGTHCTHDDYEECYDYRTRSTAIAYDCDLIGGCSEFNRKTDICVDSNILNEAWLNCGIGPLFSDDTHYQEKDCRDFNNVVELGHVCENGQVKRVRENIFYGCQTGACSIRNRVNSETVISELGDTDYCFQKRNKCGQGCEEAEYDCDFNSECAAGLECMGPILGSLDGCCPSGKSWDGQNHRCIECTEGSCCTSQGDFAPATQVCEANIPGSREFSCIDGICVGDDVFTRTHKRFCPGDSNQCTGTSRPNPPTVEDFCSQNQFCDGSAGWTQNQVSCANAECTEGLCCDNRCGVYQFGDTNHVCDAYTEEGCPFGNDAGSNTGIRDVEQFCSGSSSQCTGRIEQSSWSRLVDCSNEQFCFIDGDDAVCSEIYCSQNSDCGDVQRVISCSGGDIITTTTTPTCNNPNQPDASCSYPQNIQVRTCEFGCSDNGGSPVCNPEPNECQDECVAGSTRCISSTIRQTCGNNDEDSCTEWTADITCEHGCENNQCASQEDLPDLVFANIAIQHPNDGSLITVGREVTVVFEIENRGPVLANNVFWEGDFGPTARDPIQTNTNPISLEPRESVTVYLVTVHTQPGNVHPVFRIDPDNIIVEQREDNNRVSFSMQVR